MDDLPRVSIDYGEYLIDDRSTLYVNVTNEWSEPIDPLTVSICFDYEVWQEDKRPSREPHHERYFTGQIEHLLPEGEEGPLRAGSMRRFVLPLDSIPRVLSALESMSPENYHLTISLLRVPQQVMNGQELYEALTEVLR
jgi:hypothetical protein